MAFGPSESGVDDDALPVALKILIAGGFGVGKTTLVGSVSEIQPLLTEEYLTDESIGIDDTAGVEMKSTTTVAMDFGRITLNHDLVLYLFGTPGQDRFEFMWEVLGEGMLGYVLMLDASRPDSVVEAKTILAAFRRMAPVPFIAANSGVFAFRPKPAYCWMKRVASAPVSIVKIASTLRSASWPR